MTSSIDVYFFRSETPPNIPPYFHNFSQHFTFFTRHWIWTAFIRSLRVGFAVLIFSLIPCFLVTNLGYEKHVQHTTNEQMVWAARIPNRFFRTITHMTWSRCEITSLPFQQEYTPFTYVTRAIAFFHSLVKHKQNNVSDHTHETEWKITQIRAILVCVHNYKYTFFSLHSTYFWKILAIAKWRYRFCYYIWYDVWGMTGSTVLDLRGTLQSESRRRWIFEATNMMLPAALASRGHTQNRDPYLPLASPYYGLMRRRKFSFRYRKQ